MNRSLDDAGRHGVPRERDGGGGRSCGTRCMRRCGGSALRRRSRWGWIRRRAATLSYVHLTERRHAGLWAAVAVQRRSLRRIGTATSDFADENYLRTNDDILTLRVEHEFSPSVNLHTIARAANYPRQAQITEPQICSNASLSVPVGGVVAALPTLGVTTRRCPALIRRKHSGEPDYAGEPEPDPGQERGGQSVGPDRS